MGLINKIQEAKSEQEILDLVASGNKYTESSPKTQRRWRYVSKRAIQDLRKTTVKPPETKSTETVKVKKKS